jgi:hypothetical protein
LQTLELRCDLARFVGAAIGDDDAGAFLDAARRRCRGRRR